MCAQSKLTDTHLPSCSRNFLRSHRAEKLHSCVIIISSCYKFFTVHFWKIDDTSSRWSSAYSFQNITIGQRYQDFTGFSIDRHPFIIFYGMVSSIRWIRFISIYAWFNIIFKVVFIHMILRARFTSNVHTFRAWKLVYHIIYVSR